MSNVIVYDPDDTVVANRVTDYLKSVNTPEYEGGNTLINPSLAAVSDVNIIYWKVNAGTVVGMTQIEKDAIDASLVRPKYITSDEDEEEHTTTNTSFVEVYSFIAYLAEETYVVKWFAEITNSSSNRKTTWEFRINGTAVKAQGIYKPVDADDYEPIGAGFKYVNPSVSDVKFSVYLKTSQSNGTAKIRRNLITLRKEGA